MIISDNGGGSFKLAPEGQYAALCVDFVDLGMVEVTYDNQPKQQHKCRVVFEFQGEDSQWYAIGRKFTASLGETASLRKFLEAWRGRAFTAEELKGFETETLIGAPAIIQVTHTTKGDRTFDNINAAMKLMRGMPKPAPSGTYVRVKDRPAPPAAPAPASRPTATNGARPAPALASAPAGPSGDTPPWPDDSDSLPF